MVPVKTAKRKTNKKHYPFSDSAFNYFETLIA